MSHGERNTLNKQIAAAPYTSGKVRNCNEGWQATFDRYSDAYFCNGDLQSLLVRLMKNGWLQQVKKGGSRSLQT